MTDNEMITKIENELGKDAPWQQKLNRALELGATTTVIHWITEFTGEGLPWTNHLLQAGWSNEQVKDLFMAHCQNEYIGSEFQLFFAKNYDAWKSFTDHQELIEFLKKIVENSYINAERIILHWEDRYDELMIRFGDKQLYAIVEKAVRHLSRLLDPRTVSVLRNMERPLQRQAAARLYPAWNTIPFIVEIFKIKDRQDRRDHIAWDAKRLLPHENWPLETPGAVRWALLGGLRVPREDEFYTEGNMGMELRWAVEHRGWQFAKLKQLTDPRNRELTLGVTIDGTQGQKLIYLHDNNGVRADVLKAGDEVMVPKDPAKSLQNGPHVHAMKTLQPIRKDGKTWVFKFELHPVAPPTAVMLERPHFYFRGDDIIPPK